jgi:ABC-type Fe3+/spermidine/putrescine transport system ATPase subunit
MIQLENVSMLFDGRGIAGINGVSLTLQRGEILAVMGPNGSGKTTLINLITGKLKPEKGIVTLDGDARIFTGIEEIEDMNVQKYLIKSNLTDIEDEKKLQLARDFADIFEFTFQLRQNLSQLSAGQRQKVGLAAELINRPSLILLDEPFTHLDPHTRKDILISLFTYIRNQETSVLWVTHELEEALRFSDRLGVLNFGKFEQIDRPFAMVDQPKNLFVAQFLGFENFIPVKKIPEGWITPWGLLPGELKSEADEALLVIPSNAWKTTAAGKSATVINHYLKGIEKRFTALMEDKEMQVAFTRSGPLPALNSKIGLEADLAQCFLIPL